MVYTLAIDLGTTYSAAALTRNGEPEIFQLGSRVASIPSVVFLRADGSILTGEVADSRSVSEPTRAAREFKRRLGDPTPILLAGTPYGADTLLGHLLRSIFAHVTEQEGVPPDVVALTHPANYGPFKLDLLAEAARHAEIDSVRYLSEPEAAAIHYSRSERVGDGALIAIYDLGGGTFDAALLRQTHDGFEQVGTPEGIDTFGGIDLDQAILAHVQESLGGTLEELDPADPGTIQALARLRDECRRAKESLSADTDAAIQVMLPNVHTEVRLTRLEFEDMMRPRLRETIKVLERVVRSAGITFQDLDRVLLVGGSSRIPLVAELVRQETSVPVALDAHPKHAIVLGAAAAAQTALTASVTAAAPLGLQAEEAEIPTETVQTTNVDTESDLQSDPHDRDRGSDSGQGGTQAAAIPRASTLNRLRAAVLERAPSIRPPVALATVGVVLALLAGATGYFVFGARQAAGDVVLYEKPFEEGPDPFTEPVDVEAADVGAIVLTPRPEPGQGPFGGSGFDTVCDREKLLAFLQQNPERLVEWARVLGIDPADVPGFIRALIPATLTEDMRVTNHGFKDGRAFPLQSILAAGTAVLVDQSGEVVTRCRCGNPLLEPKPVSGARCKGCPPNYTPPRPLPPGSVAPVAPVLNPPDVQSLVSSQAPTPTAEARPAAPVGGPAATPITITPEPTEAPTPVATPSPTDPDFHYHGDTCGHSHPGGADDHSHIECVPD